MLNWIAIFGGQYLYELGGPLQGSNASLPRSDVIDASAKLWVWWGTFPGLHVGIFIAIAALVVYTLILNRTTLGFGLRAVGMHPPQGGVEVGCAERGHLLHVGDPLAVGRP